MFKMAGSAGKVFHEIINHVNKNIIVLNSLRAVVPLYNNERTLYSKASLGLDYFEQQRERTKHQLSNLEEKFKSRMSEYVSDEKNMIFTEDLKNMVHLANSNEEVELVVNMIKRFNQQNKALRFGNFKFGPVVMRLFHILNRSDLAMQCFKDESFEGFFDQLITYQIYLDLLYENKMYKEVLENFNAIKSRQVEGAMFPRNAIVLVLAACYKLNNAESLDYAFKLWKDLEQTGYYPTRRAVTYCAALALNQGHVEEALEIISNAKNQTYTTVRNIKALTLAKMGRLEDVLPILKSVINMDIPGKEVHTFNRDVLNQIKQAVLQADNPELSVEFNRIEQLLQKQGHIAEKTLDEQLCSEINNPPVNKIQKGVYNDYQNQIRRQGPYQPPRYRQRPGLTDLN